MRTWYKFGRVLTLDPQACFLWWRSVWRCWREGVLKTFGGWSHSWTGRYRLIRFEKIEPGHCYPESYPFMFGLDWRSTYKSLWLGWWLITWTIERHPWRIRDLSMEFQPGL